MEPVSVLIDRPSGNISIVTSDDRSASEIERTLTVEQAWKLVTDLNEAIQKLLTPAAPAVKKRQNRRNKGRRAA
jgi:hypothetical protein